jgi:predicted RND superfamily exporter protein
MYKVAAFIVDKYKAFVLLFIILVVFCATTIDNTIINNDLSKYLPEGTETVKGISVMEDEFTIYASAELMIANISYEKAQFFADEIEKYDNVIQVSFDDTDSHYSMSSALISVNFRGTEDDPEVEKTLAEIKEMLDGYDIYVNSNIGIDFSAILVKEMTTILLIAMAVIIVVLFFTSKSYFEVAVFLVVFGVAAVLNMGTNFIFGEISFITNSIAVILQLALAVDYAIILCHRFTEELETYDAKEAITRALSKAIIEISSSSLTTVSGLLALATMQFRIGADMGFVLIKSIFCSIFTVFLLMPGLLFISSKLIQKTMHRNFVPKISIWGKMVVKTKYFLVPVFLIVLVFAVQWQGKCDYAFYENNIDTKNPGIVRVARDKIEEAFVKNNTIVLLLPKGDYESEQQIIEKLETVPEVVSCFGLSNIEIEEDEMVLTDSLTPREFAELTGIEIELSRMLYVAYAYSNEDYTPIFQEVDEYSAPLLSIIRFANEQIEAGVVELDEEQSKMLQDINRMLDDVTIQVEGENYVNVIISANIEHEGEVAYALLDEIKGIAEPYYEEEVLLFGTTSLSRDLEASFSNDNIKISILTALFVMIVLLFTFKSVGLPFMLILTIQGSIFINFAFPYLTNSNLYFLGYLIVSAIQMGATIDYAIIITNRYQTLKKEMTSNEAVIEALNQSFPTIFTSGSIMTVCGFLIGNMSTEPIIGTIGIALGRGTLISIVLVMTVLPQILSIGDRIIEKTYFTVKIRDTEVINKGKINMDGHIRGKVSGYIDGKFVGVIKGDLEAKVQNSIVQNTENTGEEYEESKDK